MAASTEELFKEIYSDALDDYNNDPESFERRKLDYDDLMEILVYRGAIPWMMQKGHKKLLPFIDLSDVNWYGIDVSYTNFSNTNAHIDPQTVRGKNLRGCKFDGMDLAGYNFNGCDIRWASFIGCSNLDINPDKVIGFEEAIFEEVKSKRI